MLVFKIKGWDLQSYKSLTSQYRFLQHVDTVHKLRGISVLWPIFPYMASLYHLLQLLYGRLIDGFTVGFKHDRSNDFKQAENFYSLRMCAGR